MLVLLKQGLRSKSIAYFSMEIAADPRFPTYSGGLGVLAADMLRSAADAGLPMVGVTLLHRKGYFRQHLDEKDSRARSRKSGDRKKF